MRVLRICSSFEPPDSAISGWRARFDPIGGMQNHTAALSRALDRRGVHQTVLTARPPGAPRRAALGRHGAVVRVGAPVPVCRQLYGVTAARLAGPLAADADLVHVHLGEDIAVLPLAARAARRRHLPVVLTVHTSLRHTLAVTDSRSAMLRVLGGALEQRATRSVDAVITLTPRLAERLLATGVRRERLHVIPSGFEPALFAGPAGDPFPAAGHPRVVFVGRLHPQKQVDVLVQAARLLRTPGVQVLVVGDGPDRSWLEATARELGVTDRVTFTGFVPHSAVPAVLAHADVVVLPSRYEEMGSVLVEAMRVGRPIVASRTGGIPDVITDGVTGRLVPPGQPAAVAVAIDTLLTDRALATGLGQRARAAAAGYDWTSLADRVLDVYREVVAVHGRRAAVRALPSAAVGPG